MPEIYDDYWLRKPLYDDSIATEIVSKISDYYQASMASGVMGNMWKAYRVYHGLDQNNASGLFLSGNSVQTIGDQGEFSLLEINQYRNFVQHLLALLTSERPSWDPQAQNFDADSIREVQVTRHILDYQLYQKKAWQKLNECAEAAIVVGSAYIIQDWKHDRDPGDRLITRVAMPWDVCKEQVQDYDQTTWWVVRSFANRWDIAARLAAEGKLDEAKRISQMDLSEDDYVFAPVGYLGSRGDQIPVYTLYAKRTASCPDGRFTQVVGGDTILYDGGLPFHDVPISRMCPSHFIGVETPIADSWSLLPLQDAYNSLVSTNLTRADLFGIPNVVIQEGSDVTVEDLYGGNIIPLPPGSEAPQILDMLQLSGQVGSLSRDILEQMQSISGINSVAMGQPADNIKSGTMAALIQTQAENRNNKLVGAYSDLLEQVGSTTIHMYQDMAGPDEIISISGASNTYAALSFKADDIKSIQNVLVRKVSGISKHTSGRLELANMMAQQGLIGSPQEFISVINTGNLEPIMNGATDTMALISEENEQLLKGGKPIVSVVDHHALHIKHHAQMLSTAARHDQRMMDAIMPHILEHTKQWNAIYAGNPAIAAAIGLPPPPPVGAQGGVPVPPKNAPQQEPAKAPVGRPPNPENQRRGVDNRANIPADVELPKEAAPPEG